METRVWEITKSAFADYTQRLSHFGRATHADSAERSAYEPACVALETIISSP